MILEDVFGPRGEIVADQARLEELRKCYKGFELAAQILHQPHFMERVKGLYIALQTSWSWYTAEIDEVKSPLQNLQSKIELVQHAWFSGEIMEHFDHCLNDLDNLEFIGFEQVGGSADYVEQDKLVNDYVGLVMMLGSNRCYTKMYFACLPPFTFAPVASDNLGLAAQVLASLKKDWYDLMDLEAQALVNPFAKHLEGRHHMEI